MKSMQLCVPEKKKNPKPADLWRGQWEKLCSFSEDNQQETPKFFGCCPCLGRMFFPLVSTERTGAELEEDLLEFIVRNYLDLLEFENLLAELPGKAKWSLRVCIKLGLGSFGEEKDPKLTQAPRAANSPTMRVCASIRIQASVPFVLKQINPFRKSTSTWTLHTPTRLPLKTLPRIPTQNLHWKCHWNQKITQTGLTLWWKNKWIYTLILTLCIYISNLVF